MHFEPYRCFAIDEITVPRIEFLAFAPIWGQRLYSRKPLLLGVGSLAKVSRRHSCGNGPMAHAVLAFTRRTTQHAVNYTQHFPIDSLHCMIDVTAAGPCNHKQNENPKRELVPSTQTQRHLELIFR
eukprot:5237579-Amphidinium_carterae.1